MFLWTLILVLPKCFSFPLYTLITGLNNWRGQLLFLLSGICFYDQFFPPPNQIGQTKVNVAGGNNFVGLGCLSNLYLEEESQFSAGVPDFLLDDTDMCVNLINIINS